MESKLSSSIRYSTRLLEPVYKKRTLDGLRKKFGASLYEYLLSSGLGNMFSVKIEEETYPTRIMGQEVGKFSGYDRIPPEMIEEEEFRITAKIEIVQVVPIIYQISKWDYSLRKSSMPEWLKGILRWIWREND